MSRQVNGAKLDGNRARTVRPADICVETRGREIIATIVNDTVAEAMRLGISDPTPNSRSGRHATGVRR